MWNNMAGKLGQLVLMMMVVNMIMMKTMTMKMCKRRSDEGQM